MNQETTSSQTELLKWAAQVFEKHGRYSFNGTGLLLMVNAPIGDETVKLLEKAFKGTVYGIGARSCRWQVNGEPLREFLSVIVPHLTEAGRLKAEGFDLVLRGVELLKSNVRVRVPRATPEATVTSTSIKVDAFALLDGIDEDQLDIVINGDAANETGVTILKALTEAHAKLWCDALLFRAPSLFTHISNGLYIHVDKERRQHVG